MRTKRVLKKRVKALRHDDLLNAVKAISQRMAEQTSSRMPKTKGTLIDQSAVDAVNAVVPRKRSFLQRYPIVRRLLRHKAFVVGACLFLFISLVAIFANWIAPTDPSRMAVRFRFHPPDAEYWLSPFAV